MTAFLESALPSAIELSHHLSVLSKSRHPSPLKDILKCMAVPGMISLAGGLPHPGIFPFARLSLDAYPATAPLDPCTPEQLPFGLLQISVSKDPSSDFPAALQYTGAAGLPSLTRFAREFTKTVLQPGYSNFELLINGGSTDGFAKVVHLLCEPGDLILCDAHTYPSSQAFWIPLGIRGVPIAMDADGMSAIELERVLAGWNVDNPTVKRPKLLYVVPVGQNPTGATMGLARRQAVYDTCVKYDIVICEDDPYWALQFDEYEIKDGPTPPPPASSHTEFLASLEPTFLKLDYQGRVIRLDTFSKTLSPGLRLGYFTCNPVFAERLVRATEVTTQTPSGLSQIAVSELLSQWGHSGWLTWLSTLRTQYRIRRDWMCDAFATSFDLELASKVPELQTQGIVAFKKGTRTAIFSFVAPAAGMFVWCRFYLAGCPAFKKIQEIADPEQTFMTTLWSELASAKVLLTPGSYYTPVQSDKVRSVASNREAGIGYFRVAFSMATKEDMSIAVARMAAVLEAHWVE